MPDFKLALGRFATEEQADANDGKKLPVCDGALAGSSFKEPPADLEARMYDLWRDTPPAARLAAQKDGRQHSATG